MLQFHRYAKSSRNLYASCDENAASYDIPRQIPSPFWYNSFTKIWGGIIDGKKDQDGALVYYYATIDLRPICDAIPAYRKKYYAEGDIS